MDAVQRYASKTYWPIVPSWPGTRSRGTQSLSLHRFIERDDFQTSPERLTDQKMTTMAQQAFEAWKAKKGTRKQWKPTQYSVLPPLNNGLMALYDHFVNGIFLVRRDIAGAPISPADYEILISNFGSHEGFHLDSAHARTLFKLKSRNEFDAACQDIVLNHVRHRGILSHSLRH